MTTYDLHDTFATVEFADSVLARIRGLMFKDVPPSYALVHEWDRVGERTTHTFGAKVSPDVYWLIGAEVVAVEHLIQYGGRATHEADTLVQTVGGPNIEVGDIIEY